MSTLLNSIPTVFKLFHRNEKGRPFPNSIHEASIRLIPMTGKNVPRKEKFQPISLIDINRKILFKKS
jgi:hypothetical protein